MKSPDEHFFSCPYCWSSVSITVETNSGSQQYIEDCEVCCQPIEIQYKVLNGEICQFNVSRGND